MSNKRIENKDLKNLAAKHFLSKTQEPGTWNLIGMLNKLTNNRHKVKMMISLKKGTFSDSRGLMMHLLDDAKRRMNESWTPDEDKKVLKTIFDNVSKGTFDHWDVYLVE